MWAGSTPLPFSVQVKGGLCHRATCWSKINMKMWTCAQGGLKEALFACCLSAQPRMFALIISCSWNNRTGQIQRRSVFCHFISTDSTHQANTTGHTAYRHSFPFSFFKKMMFMLAVIKTWYAIVQYKTRFNKFQKVYIQLSLHHATQS